MLAHLYPYFQDGKRGGLSGETMLLPAIRAAMAFPPTTPHDGIVGAGDEQAGPAEVGGALQDRRQPLHPAAFAPIVLPGVANWCMLGRYSCVGQVLPYPLLAQHALPGNGEQAQGSIWVCERLCSIVAGRLLILPQSFVWTAHHATNMTRHALERLSVIRLRSHQAD
jgi:hypothetical protein